MIKYKNMKGVKDMNSINIKAYAKINLALDVIGKRDDGYHELNMIMQSIRLHDKIYIRKNNNREIKLKSNLPYIPVNHKNIVYKAVDLFRKTYNIKQGVFVNIYKQIPVSAGLAGGSTDAAATIKGLNKLFNTGLSLEEMMELGGKLGADVPFCMMMGTVLSQGIGDILTPLDKMPDCYILLVKPSFSVSTKKVYENFKLDHTISHPDISASIKAIKNNDLPELSSHMANVLESVTIKKYPSINQIKKLMLDNGAFVALMSGSGPTVFGLFEDKGVAKKAYDSIKKARFRKRIFLTKPYWP